LAWRGIESWDDHPSGNYSEKCTLYDHHNKQAEKLRIEPKTSITNRQWVDRWATRREERVISQIWEKQARKGSSAEFFFFNFFTENSVRKKDAIWIVAFLKALHVIWFHFSRHRMSSGKSFQIKGSLITSNLVSIRPIIRNFKNCLKNYNLMSLFLFNNYCSSDDVLLFVQSL